MGWELWQRSVSVQRCQGGWRWILNTKGSEYSVHSEISSIFTRLRNCFGIELWNPKFPFHASGLLRTSASRYSCDAKEVSIWKTNARKDVTATRDKLKCINLIMPAKGSWLWECKMGVDGGERLVASKIVNGCQVMWWEFYNLLVWLSMLRPRNRWISAS